MEESQAKKSISLGYGAFAAVLLGTLLIGFLSGGLLGGALTFVLTGRPLASSPQEGPSPPLRSIAPATDRAWLGITYVPITPLIARRYNLPVTAGALVTAVTPDSPADRAGILEEDVVTAVDGSKLDEGTSLVDMIGAKKPRDRVTLTLLRGGSEKTVEVVLGQSPAGSSGQEPWQPLERFRRSIDRLLFGR